MIAACVILSYKSISVRKAFAGRPTPPARRRIRSFNGFTENGGAKIYWDELGIDPPILLIMRLTYLAYRSRESRHSKRGAISLSVANGVWRQPANLARSRRLARRRLVHLLITHHYSSGRLLSSGFLRCSSNQANQRTGPHRRAKKPIPLRYGSDPLQLSDLSTASKLTARFCWSRIGSTSRDAWSRRSWFFPTGCAGPTVK